MSGVVKTVGKVFSAIGGIFGGSREALAQQAGPAAAAPVIQPPAPPPQAQAAQQPDQAATRTNARRPGVPGAGASSTMLTGAGGVDPRLLSLGKNTLLGS